MSKNILELKRKGNEANSNAREECTGWGEKQTNVSKMNRDGKWIQSDSHQMGMSAVVWEVGDEKGRWVSNRLVRFEKRSKGKAVSGNLSSECFSSVIRYMGTDQFYNGTSECAFFFKCRTFWNGVTPRCWKAPGCYSSSFSVFCLCRTSSIEILLHPHSFSDCLTIKPGRLSTAKWVLQFITVAACVQSDNVLYS